MRKIIFAVIGVLFMSTASAQSPASKVPEQPGVQGCEARAKDKNGKPLAGAARNSFLKKCTAAAGGTVARCEAEAVGKNGKALAGAARTSYMKKCMAG
jgi:hypothetical protein